MTDPPHPQVPEDADETHRAEQPTIAGEARGIPWGLAAFLLGVVLLVVFVVQNVQEVALRFLAWEGRYPLALIIILVIALTIVLDEILGALIRRRRRKRRAEREELRRLRDQR